MRRYAFQAKMRSQGWGTTDRAARRLEHLWSGSATRCNPHQITRYLTQRALRALAARVMKGPRCERRGNPSAGLAPGSEAS
jgi:hypothetical protein